jgi:hypothetical protein
MTATVTTRPATAFTSSTFANARAGWLPDRGPGQLAAARGIRLTEVCSTVVGDVDLNGILGLNPGIRNGYQSIVGRFTVKGHAPAEKRRELVEKSRDRSVVLTSSPIRCR